MAARFSWFQTVSIYFGFLKQFSIFKFDILVFYFLSWVIAMKFMVWFRCFPKSTVFRDIQLHTYILIVWSPSVSHIKVKVAANAEAVQGVGEENPLVLHLSFATIMIFWSNLKKSPLECARWALRSIHSSPGQRGRASQSCRWCRRWPWWHPGWEGAGQSSPYSGHHQWLLFGNDSYLGSGKLPWITSNTSHEIILVCTKAPLTRIDNLCWLHI